MKLTKLALALVAGASTPALAQSSTTQLPPVDVDTASATADDSGATTIARDHIERLAPSTSDTAAILTRLPGVSGNSGGGFSTMPAIRGLTEQRLTVLVDGHPIDSACPNDMNTPLSYTDPQTVASVAVITGVSPVSAGGDAIGGVIAVNSAAPRFATGGGLLVTGEAQGYYRSNDGAFGTGLSLTVAGAHLSATYTGSYAKAANYSAGGDLGTVHSTQYAKTDHKLALAWQGDIGLVELAGGYHHSAYEGFPNQFMDMTGNNSWFLNGHYLGSFAWGTVDFKADYRATDHEMNFLADKGGVADGGMPMNTRVRSGGYTLAVSLPVAAGTTLRLGHEYRHENLDDWWPPVAGSMMMGPNTYLNVNQGRRERIAGYLEAEQRVGDAFTVTAGGRFDRVNMNTGDVAPYSTSMMNMADAMAASAFNAADHQRHFNNWSGSLIARYAPTAGLAFDLGYAHKTRAPNIYELYTWGQGTMSSQMIGWYGDGNGYFGNLALRPERADTISGSVTLSGGGKQGWFIKLAPFYTHVNDYIDARFVKALGGMMGMSSPFVQLQFANEEAEFHGLDVSGAVPLWNGGRLGQTRLTGTLSWVHGQNLTYHTPLYHQMPLNVQTSLTHTVGGFSGAVEVNWVASKTRVDPARNEPETAAYALVNLRTAYALKGWRLSLDVENLLDKGYYLPLGGMALGDYSASGNMVLRPVAGRGRSFNVGLSRRF
ncbi:TonB-dependent receptor plug domain-containing protein [Novosphingobium pokkalii]|uniref:TonB-dependent receptor plug domain-containing protein n=1 Tax=Novosphingobium pokkalii TaxID=1770194 RepID=A0ABV7V3U2_9SPHN|nr:TonB-dependent receptor [Novosphingobium pokkalii]GHD04022.1 TonB-dependent receptor [Novosphingobium pokkalii]